MGTTKKTWVTKAALKKITAEKRRVGKAASKAAGKRNALAMKKAGKGIFAPKKLSDALAAIWVYIKKNALNQGRTIKPDSKLKAVFPVASLDMLKMAGYVSKHLS